MAIIDSPNPNDSQRAFFACCCDSALSEALHKQIGELEARLKFGLRRPPAGSHHVTLCFVPALPSASISSIWKEIQLFPADGPIPFTLGPVEALTRQDRCRLLLRRVELKHERVAALQRHIELSIRRVCADIELRLPTQYHITVARISAYVSRAVCKSALSRGGVAEAESNVAGGVFQKLSLIRSELTPSGPIYSTLHEREL
ncbi:MAG: hypothetical protein ABSG59_10230 [Verrucomicrobiota bacterium]|jgi:2'-5' RNA ligase